MFIFRVISLVVIALALMLLGYDALTSLEQKEIALLSLADVMDRIDPGIAGSLLSWGGSLPGPASTAIDAVLDAPSWVPIGVLGLILGFIFQARD